MSSFIERPRYVCALGGALGTLNALPGVIPIVHAASGCGGNISNAQNAGSGYLGGGYCGGLAVPSSNVYEQEIVFGGEERLAEQITNTLKVVEGELYFVVSGCMTEMIGDDVKAVAKGFKHRGLPVLAAETGGMRGNAYLGYDLVLQTLFRDYVNPSPVKDAQKLNLWGIVPAQDVFWKGNLQVLKDLLTKVGYQVNTFFGEGETLADLENAGSAALNIVVSQLYGIKAAETFTEIHGTPYISLPLPIGPTGGEEFLRAVAQALKTPEDKVAKVIAAEKASFYGYFERLADAYNDLDLQRYAVVVGDSNYARALTGFLADDLGWLPELVVITDDLADEEKPALAESFKSLRSGFSPHVVFETNASQVAKHLREIWPAPQGQKYYDAFSPAFILGSVLERDLATSLGVPFLSVTYPISNRVVLDRAYAGYSGALRLTEDLFSTLVATR